MAKIGNHVNRSLVAMVLLLLLVVDNRLVVQVRLVLVSGPEAICCSAMCSGSIGMGVSSFVVRFTSLVVFLVKNPGSAVLSLKGVFLGNLRVLLGGCNLVRLEVETATVLEVIGGESMVAAVGDVVASHVAVSVSHVIVVCSPTVVADVDI